MYYDLYNVIVAYIIVMYVRSYLIPIHTWFRGHASTFNYTALFLATYVYGLQTATVVNHGSLVHISIFPVAMAVYAVGSVPLNYVVRVIVPMGTMHSDN